MLHKSYEGVMAGKLEVYIQIKNKTSLKLQLSNLYFLSTKPKLDNLHLFQKDLQEKRKIK
jgi:hypothetical protein